MNNQEIPKYCQDNFYLTGSRKIFGAQNRDWDFIAEEMPECLKPFFRIHIDKRNPRNSSDIVSHYLFDNTITHVWRRWASDYCDQIDIQIVTDLSTKVLCYRVSPQKQPKIPRNSKVYSSMENLAGTPFLQRVRRNRETIPKIGKKCESSGGKKELASQWMHVPRRSYKK